MDFLNPLKYVFLCGITLFLTACQIPYLINSAYHQAKILVNRTPIEEALKSEKLSLEDKAKLQLTKEVREFARIHLSLNTQKNYTTFSQLSQPYVSYAVSASEKYALKNYLWHFPIVGDVPYLGFPTEKEANEEAEALKKKDYDTYVRGVSAFSTLGWFNDPVLSSMLRYKEHDLVNTIIHESVHATIYIKSNADFNESLASFIGDIATEQFYYKKEGIESPTVKLIHNENADSKLFHEWFQGQFKALNTFYVNLENKQEPLRQAAFERIRKNFEADVLPFLKTESYKWFGQKGINNATLMLYQTYSADNTTFEKLFEICKNDFNCFMKHIKEIENSEEPSEDLKLLIKKLKS